MKKINKMPKKEQFFLVLLMFSAAVTLLCLTGCGGKSCETPDCGRFSDEGIKSYGCSIPGCGGCLSSGEGCDSCLWAQSVKLVSGSYKDEGVEYKGCGCDTRYFGDGCLGCNQTEKAAYAGYMSGSFNNDSVKGAVFFSGSTDEGERYIGCVDGCVKCGDFEYTGGSAMGVFEALAGVD